MQADGTSYPRNPPLFISGAFEKLRKAIINFVISGCPSVRPSGTTRPSCLSSLCVCVCVCITYVRIYTTHRAAEIQQTSSVVGKQVGYGMDGPGLESRWGQAFSPFSTTSRPALGLSNAYRSSLPGIKRPRHEVNLHLVPMLRMNGPIRLLPLYAFMASTKMTFTIIRRNHPTVKN